MSGLSDNEVANRRQLYGKNILPTAKKQGPIIRFLKHFNDILIYILLVAGVVTFFLEHYIDTVVIVVVAVINACIGYFQESKAEKALEDIKKMLSLKAQVLRNGVRVEIDADSLTLGDVVYLQPGDKVPADLRLIRADNLRIEESPLTGESVPVEKSTYCLPADTMLGDRINIAFSSTAVRSGTGLGIVVAIGENTEIGKINRMMSGIEELSTPLLKQTAQFGRYVSAVILLGSALTFAFGYLFGDYNDSDLLMSVIGLAIAVIPEGLPAILSIILAVGVQNMSKRNAIISNLPSVETLGSVSVICSDKTGTLTKNEMTVKTIETRDEEYFVTGTGYSPEGDIYHNCNNEDCRQDSSVRDCCELVDFDKTPVLVELLEAFNICNEAILGRDDEDCWFINGDPTEGSLVTLFHKANIEHTTQERISTIPFDSEYKYMATLIERETDNIIIIKGAPDRLMEMSQFEKTNLGTEPFLKEH